MRDFLRNSSAAAHLLADRRRRAVEDIQINIQHIGKSNTSKERRQYVKENIYMYETLKLC